MEPPFEFAAPFGFISLSLSLLPSLLSPRLSVQHFSFSTWVPHDFLSGHGLFLRDIPLIPLLFVVQVNPPVLSIFFIFFRQHMKSDSDSLCSRPGPLRIIWDLFFPQTSLLSFRSAFVITFLFAGENRVKPVPFKWLSFQSRHDEAPGLDVTLTIGQLSHYIPPKCILVIMADLNFYLTGREKSANA